MGFYRAQILPRLVDRACAMPMIRPWRADVAQGLFGRVVEIGFGSGLNVEHYPPEVEVVLAVEPAAVAQRLASRRIAASRITVERVASDGQALPFADGTCDGALLTFTLCTVSVPAAVLGELYRVLRPRGRLHFLEHGIAPDPSVVAWQRRLEPLQRRCGGGCHLTRAPDTLVTGAGFLLEREVKRYAPGPKPWSYFTLGIATRPP